MAKSLKNKGFTFIEVLIATFAVGVFVVGSMGLVSNIYTGILSTSLKTYSFNLVSENMEIMKSYSFGALKVTGDDVLPAEPLSRLEVNDLEKNPWGNPADPDNIVWFGGGPAGATMTGKPMKVYRVVQYAVEDEDGNIVSKKQSELPTNYEKNLKSIRVVVVYEMKMGNSNVTKQTELTSFVSNAETSFAGATIKGYVAKMDRQCIQDGETCDGDTALTRATCRCFPPGHMADVTVYIENHPEYTAKTNTDNQSPEYGMYTLRNVLPGKYNIYGIGEGYDRGAYLGNPLEVNIGDTEILGINITTPMDNSVEINGDVIYNGSNILKSDYRTTKIWAVDGRSQPTTANDDGTYLISNVNKDNSPTTVYALLIDYSNNVYFGSVAGVALNGNPSADVTVTLSPSTTGSVIITAKDARYKATPVSGVNLTLTHLSSQTPIPTVTTASGTGTYANIPVGRYRLSAAKDCWALEKTSELNNDIDVVPVSPDKNIYLFPSGSISGTITEEITGQPPSKPVNVQAFSSGKKIGEAYSNTATGQYTLENVYAGSQNTVRLYFDENEYVAVTPENAILSGVSVSQCGTTTNQNFTIRLSYDTISGSFSMTGVEQSAMNDGVIILAQPSTNTRMPHQYQLDSGNADLRRQNALSRKNYPFYGSVAKRNSTFQVMVPRGSTYDVYAYYSYVTYTSITDMRGSILKYYKKISSVAPPATDQDFSGSWISY